MKKTIFLFLSLIVIGQNVFSLTVNSTAGGLAAAVGSELNTVTNLTITGTIDARDFVTMYNMQSLADIDLTGVIIAAYNGAGGPSGSNGDYSANTIPVTAFRIGKSGKSSLKTIVLPSTLTTIGNLAFQDCTGLTSVAMSTGVTTIMNSAFSNCTSLNAIVLPSTLNTIEYYAFQYCGNLISMNIPASVTAIGSDVFLGTKAILSVESANANYSSHEGILYNKLQTSLIHCPISKLGSYSIPSSVSVIEGNAFAGCTGLTEVIIPSTVNSIKSGAFNGCTGLLSFSFPSQITTLTSKVLYNCTSLHTVTIPASVSTIEYGAFGYCTALTSINIPASVTNIVNDVFLNSSGSITVDTNNSNYSSDAGVLYNKAKTILYHCPTNKVGAYVIPPTVTTIMATSFQSCGQLTSITIPSSTNAIGQYAFAFCTGLTTIIANPVVPVNLTNSYGVFETITKNTCALIVPAGSYNAYKTANTWSNFINTVETAPVSTLSLSTNTLGLLAANNSTASFDISSNISWTASSDQTWLTVSNTSGSNNAIITVTATVNSLTTTRTAIVTVSATGLASQMVTITQAPAQVLTLEISKNSLEVSSTANSSTTFNIISNTSWTISSDQSECVVSPTSGSNNATITVTATTANTSNTTRTANLTITGTGVAPIAIPAVQAAAVAGVSKTVNVTTPGGILTAIGNEYPNVTNLKVTGTIDARDFKQMGYYMSNLMELDLSSATIAAYTGTAGTYPGNTVYPINTIPIIALSPISPNYYSRKLTSIILPTSTTLIDNQAFYGCIGLVSVSIPSTVTINIVSGAFYGCTNLKSINIPSSVSTIGASAFYGCSNLTSITIPASVTSIGNSFLSQCSGLTTIYANRLTPVDLSASANAFYNVNKTSCVLYVPIGAKLAYQNAAIWQEFTNIVETTTALPILTNCNLKIYTSQSAIIVEGTSVGEIVSVYNLVGVELKSIQSQGERLSIPLKSSGIYLIKTVSKIMKVIL